MALDEAAELLRQTAAQGRPPLHEQTPEQASGTRAARREHVPPGPAVAVVRDTSVEVPGGYVPIRVLTPKTPDDRSRGVIVWYHGGGWAFGGLDDADPVGRALAQRTGCTVVLVDYRLAPEHRSPTAVDDSWTALRWAAEQLPGLTGTIDLRNGSSAPLIVAGDSTGGNVAAIMAQRARAAGGPALAAQILVYPASPPQIPDLADLPAAAVLNAEHNVPRDDGYAMRLLDAGVAFVAASLDEFCPTRA